MMLVAPKEVIRLQAQFVYYTQSSRKEKKSLHKIINNLTKKHFKLELIYLPTLDFSMLTFSVLTLKQIPKIWGGGGGKGGEYGDDTWLGCRLSPYIFFSLSCGSAVTLRKMNTFVCTIQTYNTKERKLSQMADFWKSIRIIRFSSALRYIPMVSS